MYSETLKISPNLEKNRNVYDISGRDAAEYGKIQNKHIYKTSMIFIYCVRYHSGNQVLVLGHIVAENIYGEWLGFLCFRFRC